MECPFFLKNVFLNRYVWLCLVAGVGWCLRVSCHNLIVFLFFLQSSSPQTEAPKEIIAPSSHSESTALPLENRGASAGKGIDVPHTTVPTIVISQCEPPPEPPEEAEAEKEQQSANENSFQDKTEDSDNPLTSHFKMIFKGLARSRSQESLASAKMNSEEGPPHSDSTPHCSQNGDLQEESAEGPSWRHFNSRSHKKEKITFRLSGGANKTKGKDQGTSPRGEDCPKSQGKWEQMEATKAIFDLLKEISGLFSVQTQGGLLITLHRIIPVFLYDVHLLKIMYISLPTFLKHTAAC